MKHTDKDDTKKVLPDPKPTQKARYTDDDTQEVEAKPPVVQQSQSFDNDQDSDGLGTINLRIPAGRDLPDSGTVTLEYASTGETSGEGRSELKIVRIHSIQPILTQLVQKRQPIDDVSGGNVAPSSAQTDRTQQQQLRGEAGRAQQTPHKGNRVTE